MQEKIDCLTPREKEVFNLLIQLYPDAKIADVLVVSVPTVRKHVVAICKKFDFGRTDRNMLVNMVMMDKIEQLEHRVRACDEKVAGLVITSENLLKIVNGILQMGEK